MSTKQLSDLDFNSASRILNLPDAVSDQQPATFKQLNAVAEGLKQKDPARVRTTSNINIASPGSTLDGVTMATNDRVLLTGQTDQTQNGIYIWNGAATPMTRSLDANAALELVNALVPVAEGTDAGKTFRQTASTITLGSTNIVFVQFGTSAGAATETSAGIAELATQAETDTGTDDTRIVTPLKLASYSGRKLKLSQNIGDGSATQYTVTHNFNTRDVYVTVMTNSGNFDTVNCDIERTSVNAVRLTFAVAPTSNQYRVVVIG